MDSDYTDTRCCSGDYTNCPMENTTDKAPDIEPPPVTMDNVDTIAVTIQASKPVIQEDCNDIDSYNSETPLIDADHLVLRESGSYGQPEKQANDTYRFITDNYENETYQNESMGSVSDTTSVEQPYNGGFDGKGQVLEFHGGNNHADSELGLQYTELSDVQVGATNLAPITIIGSGWEFGSICSVNLHAGNDKARSRNQDRLLSRIFSKTVQQIDRRLSKGHDKPLPLSFDKTKSDIVGDASLHFEGASEKGRNARNLLILSLSMTLLHIAIFGLRNLQSSLNSEAGLGVFSLAAIFAAFMVGSLISTFIVKRFPPKTCLCYSTLGNLLYIFANYYPSFYTIIPSSIIMGFSNAVLWNAICTYITEIGINEAEIKNKPLSNVLSRYFGIFFLILQLSVVFGNFISSIILMCVNCLRDGGTSANSISSDSVINESSFSNATYRIVTPFNATVSTSTVSICGVNQCFGESGPVEKRNVDDMDKLFILGTYSSCGILAVVVIHCLLDNAPNYVPTSSSIKEVMQGIRKVLGMSLDRHFVFVILLCMYTVFSNGFVVADVLKAFITCPLGVQMVGYSMICFGICGSLSSYVFGKLTKCIGRTSVFLIAAILNLTSLALMKFWEPLLHDQWWLMALLGSWGLADGIWQSQINSLISTVFADRYEAAFSCCRVLQGMAGIIIFLMSNVLCMNHKIIFVAGTCVLSVMSYLVMEVLVRRDNAAKPCQTDIVI